MCCGFLKKKICWIERFEAHIHEYWVVFEDLSRELLQEKFLVFSTDEIFAHNSTTLMPIKSVCVDHVPS